MNKILVAIVIVLLIPFAILIPFVPISLATSQANVIRNQCPSPTVGNSAKVWIFGSVSFLVSGLFSHYADSDLGVTYLPSGIPYKYDNSSFYFLPFLPLPPEICPIA
jgi:hypothetical protein